MRRVTTIAIDPKRIAVILLATFALVAASPVSARAEFGEDLPFHLGRATFAKAMTAGPDGAVWFLAERNYAGKLILGKMTATGEVTEFPLNAVSPTRQHYRRTETIVTGPDGKLWFGELEAVAPATTTGGVTAFPLPPGASTPTAMTVGPDGNIWFTEGAASRIGRITPRGKYAEFPLPPGRKPSGIAAGSDSNLWFTERGADEVGRITPTGQITEFPVPGTHDAFDSIAAGPDGNLWFAEAGAPRVGKITPQGDVTQFNLPTVLGPQHIVAGPDGLLYFSSYSEIGAIAPSGAISWPACLAAFCSRDVESLTLGPDGKLWASSGHQQCISLCGGGAALGLEEEPGWVEPFSLPPLRLAIAPRLTRLRTDNTTLGLACGLESGCRGTVRLGLYVYRHHHRHFRVFSHADFELQQGEGGRITMPFSAQVATYLHRHKSYRLIAKALDEGGAEAQRGLTLRRGPA